MRWCHLRSCYCCWGWTVRTQIPFIIPWMEALKRDQKYMRAKVHATELRYDEVVDKVARFLLYSFTYFHAAKSLSSGVDSLHLYSKFRCIWIFLGCHNETPCNPPLLAPRPFPYCQKLSRKKEAFPSSSWQMTRAIMCAEGKTAEKEKGRGGEPPLSFRARLPGHREL